MKFPSSITFCLVAAVILGPNPPFAVASLRSNNGLHHYEEHTSQVLEAALVGTYLVKDQSRVYDRDLQANYDRDLQADLQDQTANIELPDGRIYEVYNAMVGWENSLQLGRDKVVIPKGTVIYSNGKMNVKGKNLHKENQGKDGFVRRNLLEQDIVERTPEQELNLAALQSR